MNTNKLLDILLYVMTDYHIQDITPPFIKDGQIDYKLLQNDLESQGYKFSEVTLKKSKLFS